MGNRNLRTVVALTLTLVLGFSLTGPFVPGTDAKALPSMGHHQLNSLAPFIEAEGSFDENGGVVSSTNSPVFLTAVDDWLQKSPSSKPSARDYHAMANIGGDQVLLFGGVDGTYDDETWLYDLSDDTWTNQAPASKPSGRGFHAMANIGGDQVLLFGGFNGILDDETWVYDLSENSWTQKSPASKPSARQVHAMANIGSDQVLLFGGYDGTADDETWVYDLSANTWTKQTPASEPSARYYHAMANIGADQVLLFAGSSGNDETWVYDLSATTWTNQAPASGPSARESTALANISGDQVLLFGGSDGDNNDETWVYDLSDNSWTQKSPATKPSARDKHALANIGGDQVLLFGGWDGAYDDETWVYPSAYEIFADGFESGDLTAWDSAKTSSGDLKACRRAAVNGAYGMCVKNNTNKPKFVKDDGFNESAYSVQFNLDPNGLKSKNKKKIRIFLAKVGSKNTTWIEFRRKTGVYYIRAWAGLDGGGETKTSWYSISNSPHLIELDWSASTGAGANDGFLKLYKDDVLKQQLSGLNNDTFEVEKIKLGFTKKPTFSVTGIFYMDDFKSTNGGHIGP